MPRQTSIQTIEKKILKAKSELLAMKKKYDKVSDELSLLQKQREQMEVNTIYDAFKKE